MLRYRWPVPPYMFYSNLLPLESLTDSWEPTQTVVSSQPAESLPPATLTAEDIV